MAIPIKLLYIGAAGEHYVMSECYRCNMEAFKLPIDRGFDLAITRAYTHFKAAEDKKAQPSSAAPIFLQVKSSFAKSTDHKAGQRPVWEGKFHIKVSELDLLCETINSALACVVFVEIASDLSLARKSFAWWISNEKLKELKKESYFIPKDTETFTLSYRVVGEEKDSPFNQNTYVQMMRQSLSAQAKPGELATGYLVDKDCFYFDKVPCAGL